ncbi:5_t:CDS:2 [Entrophospora sp. SA101]|nr:5_t:CDS:2 [Entrophospora sp. SA101]
MASLGSKPKGILKKPSVNFQSKQPRLTWDEDNIQLTEGQKDSTMKITEPKTPYIHYNQETDEIMTDLESLGLALGGGGRRSSSNSISPDGSLFSTSPSSAHFPDSIKGEWDSDTEEDEEAREKRRKFAQLRSKHYNMKEALKLGLKLVEKDMTGDKGKEKEQEEVDDNIARFLSYLGKSLEPYSTQNKLLSFLTTPTSTCDKTAILHLPNDLKQVCPVFKFAVTTDNKYRDDGDVATNDDNFNNLENIQVLVNLKIELNYVDPLKEYLVVILDKENGEILEIFTDKGEDDRNIEPTFEDVMVSWMADFDELVKNIKL